MNKSTCKCCNNNKKCKGISTNRCPFYFGKHGDAESWSNSRFHCCWKSLLKARKKTNQEIQPNFQQTPEIPTVLALSQIRIRMTPSEISLCGECSKRNLSAVNHLHSTEATILTLNYGASFSWQEEMNYWFHANYFTSPTNLCVTCFLVLQIIITNTIVLYNVITHKEHSVGFSLTVEDGKFCRRI